MGDDKRPVQLKCLYANLQSLFSKKHEIEALLDHQDYDLLFFTEIWIKPDFNAADFSIQGFQTPIVDPHIRGGACIYVRNELDFYIVEPPMKTEQSTWLVIKTSQGIPRLHACVYRSPNSSDLNNEKLFSNLSWATNNYSEIIIVGDFNAPRVNWTHDEGASPFERRLIDCVNDNFLQQLIDVPTRYRFGQNPSLLDLILTSDPDFVENVKVHEPFGKSDHCIIEFGLKNAKSEEIKGPLIMR